MDWCRHAIVRLVISVRKTEKEVIQLRPFIFSETFSPERAAIFEFQAKLLQDGGGLKQLKVPALGQGGPQDREYTVFL